MWRAKCKQSISVLIFRVKFRLSKVPNGSDITFVSKVVAYVSSVDKKRFNLFRCLTKNNGVKKHGGQKV